MKIRIRGGLDGGARRSVPSTPLLATGTQAVRDVGGRNEDRDVPTTHGRYCSGTTRQRDDEILQAAVKQSGACAAGDYDGREVGLV